MVSKRNNAKAGTASGGGPRGRKKGRPIFRSSRRDITDLVHWKICEELNDETRLAALITGFTEDLVSQTVDPSCFSDPVEFSEHYWRAESLSKFPFQIEGVDRATRALDAFDVAEQHCEIANRRLVYFPNDYCATSKVVHKARGILRRLLRGISPEEVVRRARWGPGASTSLSRVRSSPQNKWEFGTHITEGALPWIEYLRKWSGRDFKATLVYGNLVTTVPKNAKTDRIIAIEPDWNSFIQLGIGAAIRSRLQRDNLLLANSQLENQQLALRGSEDNELATIDLKAASDTVSLGLCDLLIPDEPGNQFSLKWMLATARSPEGLVGDRKVVYQKISSMGNGYTFELETALFYALARACSPSGIVRVYGDDVILPSRYAPLFVEVLTDLGMEVNLKKSFISGPFRESCGGHFFRGNTVTPPYFRERVLDVPSYIRAYNKLVTFFGKSDLTEEIRKDIPRFLWGPASRGDTVLRSAWDQVTPEWHRGFQAWRLVEAVEQRGSANAPENGALLHALWGAQHVSQYPTKDRVVKLQKYTSDSWNTLY